MKPQSLTAHVVSETVPEIDVKDVSCGLLEQLQRRKEPGVLLYDVHLPCPVSHEGAGDAARSRPHLHHHLALQVADAAGQAIQAFRIEQEVLGVRKAGARYLFHDQPDYPALLAELDSAPPIITCRGNLALASEPCVAMVGARNASSLGTRMARTLASELGEAGFVVVSGLARGVDAAAHLAALPTGTIAVQAGGVDVIYPAENTKLAEDIASNIGD